ncbi:hypothetical protein ACE7GA_24195 [Roseomonas sp. CCTCC AB2023176]|uniref:hypothetical protein n=1 Tax=Roseomonas sp. CCTCC AB2023176 TaxID=3342640 RepID=UPI0035D6B0AB
MSTIYVSASVANGIPAGNDRTGDGSLERPFATLERAHGAAQSGDTLMLNDGVYSPTKTFEITKSLSIQGVTDYGATIRGVAGQSRVIGIDEGEGGAVTIGKIVVDGANTTASLFTLRDQTVPYNLTLDGTRLVDPVRYGVSGTSLGTWANVTLRNVEFRASSALSMVYVPSLREGSVSITGGSVDIASVWRSGFGGIATVNADAIGPAVSVSGVRANLNATGTDPTYGQGIYYGVRLTDVAGSVIEGNDITQTGSSGGLIGATVSVTYDRVAPLDASGGIIRYNTLRNYLTGAAGKIIMVGADSDPGVALQDNANDFRIYGNSGFGNQNAEGAKLHGILVGWQDGAEVFDNVMDFTSLAYVLKGMSGRTLVYDNLDTRTTSKSLYQKGGADVQFLYNTSFQPTGFRPDLVNIGDNGVGEYNASGAVVVGNSLAYAGASEAFLVVTPGSTASQISANQYYAGSGTTTDGWMAGGVTYDSFAAWRAAQEYTATFGPIGMVGFGAILDAKGLSGQRLQDLGMVNGVQTYAIRFVNGLASTSTFSIANLGAAGAAPISGLYDAEFGASGTVGLSGSALLDGSYGPLGAGESRTFTLSYDGATAFTAGTLQITGNYVNTRPIEIRFLGVDATPPSIIGSGVTGAGDNQTVSPFATMIISDSNASTGGSTLRVRLLQPENGVLTSSYGLIADGAGGYGFSGTADEINATLRSLRFTPTRNQVAPGASVTTDFEVAYDNGVYSVAATTVQAKAVSMNDAPILDGFVTSQTVSERSVILPWAEARYADPDFSATGTIRLTMDKTSRGTFTNLAGFSDLGNGSYSFTGTAADAGSALRSLTFKPAEHQAVPGDTTTAKFTLTYTDGLTAERNTVSYLSISAENTAPVITGATTSSIRDIQTVKPFAALTLADPDKNPVETATVRLDDPAKGVFTTLGGFVSDGAGGFTFSGSPSAVQSALRKIVFDPTDNRTPTGTIERVRFSVTISDGMAASFDDRTEILVSGTARVGSSLAASSLAA